MDLKKLVQGKTVSTKQGRFMLVERDLREMNGNPIKDYIEKHRKVITLERIRRRFPYLTGAPKKDMLFFDIETCGFSYSSPILSIGLADLAGGISTRCLFARDYSEERAILSYFLGLMPQYQIFFTYHGNSFDLSRLDKRLKANGLNGKKNKTLKEMLGQTHIDLRQEVRKLRLGFDLGLQTLEKLALELSRDKDIPSKKIPKTYRDYVYGADNEQDIARIIRHNMHDTLTLIALLAYICKR